MVFRVGSIVQHAALGAMMAHCTHRRHAVRVPRAADRGAGANPTRGTDGLGRTHDIHAGAVLSLHRLHGLDDRSTTARADKASVLLAIVGSVNIPIIYFSVRVNSLYPRIDFSRRCRLQMAPDMVIAMVAMIFACWAYTIAVSLICVRAYHPRSRTREHVWKGSRSMNWALFFSWADAARLSGVVWRV